MCLLIMLWGWLKIHPFGSIAKKLSLQWFDGWLSWRGQKLSFVARQLVWWAICWKCSWCWSQRWWWRWRSWCWSWWRWQRVLSRGRRCCCHSASLPPSSDDLTSRSMLVAAAAKQSHQQQQQRTTQPPVSVFPVPCSGALLLLPTWSNQTLHPAQTPSPAPGEPPDSSN